MEEFVKKLETLSLVSVDNITSLQNKKDGYLIDANVPNVLAFHRSYPVTAIFSQEYVSGAIILQDKASCIPATLLNVPAGATVLDACAAPGNKTTQLAGGVDSKGTVFAVEKDSKRAITLQTMVDKAGASKCTSHIFSL
jgi:25S rRNA (cytosine2278-C5)-methyltransferase